MGMLQSQRLKRCLDYRKRVVSRDGGTDRAAVRGPAPRSSAASGKSTRRIAALRVSVLAPVENLARFLRGTCLNSGPN